VEPVAWVDFEDHHRYRPRELRHISQEMRAQGATALVTTEKDIMNLCEGPATCWRRCRSTGSKPA